MSGHLQPFPNRSPEHKRAAHDVVDRIDHLKESVEGDSHRRDDLDHLRRLIEHGSDLGAVRRFIDAARTAARRLLPSYGSKVGYSKNGSVRTTLLGLWDQLERIVEGSERQ